MMPNLPNVDMERDMESFREFFENPAFRTDGLKLYLTVVIRGTGLYELWKTGKQVAGRITLYSAAPFYFSIENLSPFIIFSY